MVIGSHLILSAYGFWLPNDPRGSWSEFVGAWELVRFGRATKVHTVASVAAAPHDVAARRAAKAALQYPEVHFSGAQARAVGRGFAEFARKAGLSIWACSILPQHVHMVVARHTYEVEQVATLLKGEATRRLVHEGLHSLAAFQGDDERPPSPWLRGEWKVFLDSPADVRRAVEYVEANPEREGLPRQRWSFVKPVEW
jgi:REP element-mobilizing transposase RayT